MPRRKRASFPSLRSHKPSGLAVVTLSGQDWYCGTYGSKASLAEYDRLIAEWLERGRRPLFHAAEQSTGGITVVELLADYKRFAEGYYVKNGRITSEVNAYLSVARVVSGMYADEPADSFGPLKLQAVQQAMIRLGWTRRTINKQCQRLVRMFSWGVSKEKIKPNVVQALREVKGLRKGRSEAVESSPVRPVDDAAIHATLDCLPPVVVDMVRLQRLTGCRPDEVCAIRPCDVDTGGEVWAYTPESHKMEHKDKNDERRRVIFIGPKGQEILRPYLLRDKSTYCFCPAEGERKRREVQHEARVTPITYGNRPGTNRKAKPGRPAGARYTTASYRRAIQRAAEKAGLTSWSPNQLRHSAATEIRKRFGLESAQVVLGHSAADVSQIYAERDQQKAAAVMAEVG